MLILNLLYIALALFGIGFLIFIHELGHYFMARRVGIKVEVFAIGFGKPIKSWEHQGVKWQLGWLPFGGYVKMAGTEKKGGVEPHQIPDGFFGKKPSERILVALMGPLINILFAFLAFSVIWFSGGRTKSFAEYTHMIGWVDRDSTLYEVGVRAGDEIDRFDRRTFQGFNDLLYASILGEKNPKIEGQEIDYQTGKKEPFEFTLSSERDLKGIDRGTMTVGVLSPANYLIFNDRVVDGSPMLESKIQDHDRIIWIDGQLIFSKRQLMQILNESKTLLTVDRAGTTFLTRLPRLHLSDLRTNVTEKAELGDWQHAADLKGRLQDLYFVPYVINQEAIVESSLPYIDDQSDEKQRFTPAFRSPVEVPLEKGDRILAVDGMPVQNGVGVLTQLQQRQVQIIVERGAKFPRIAWKEADANFFQNISFSDLQRLSSSIGLKDKMQEAGNLYLLQPVSPKPLNEFPLSPEKRASQEEMWKAQKRMIEQISDPQQKAVALKEFEEGQKRLILGIGFQDRDVAYNPSPIKLFCSVFEETWRTLLALINGYLSPKMLSGPVGIVQVIHYGWTTGVKEALYWMGVISLNLGILNLLPIPVLDGGHICFALIESVTKKPIKAKTMEKLVIPFVILLVGLFIYLTYHDLSRLFHRFF